MSVGKTVSLAAEYGKLVEVRKEINEISSELRGEEGEGRCLGGLFRKVEESQGRLARLMLDGFKGTYEINDYKEISSLIRARLTVLTEKVARNKVVLENVDQRLESRTLQKNSHAAPVGSRHRKVLHEERSLMEQVASLQKKIEEACGRLENMPTVFLPKDPVETGDVGSALQTLVDEEASSTGDVGSAPQTLVDEEVAPDESQQAVFSGKTEAVEASGQEEKSESLSTKPNDLPEDESKPWSLNSCKNVSIVIGCATAVTVGLVARIFFLTHGGFCGGGIS